MHRTGLTDELASESFKYWLDANKNAPERIRGLRVVRVVDHIFIEADRVRYFYRHRPDLHIDAHPSESVQDESIEFRNGHRLE